MVRLLTLACFITLLFPLESRAGGFLADTLNSMQFNKGAALDNVIKNMGKAMDRAAEDTGKPLDKAGANGKSIEKSAHDTGHAIEKSAQPANSADPDKLIRYLFTRTKQDLLTYSVASNICSVMPCFDVQPETARQLVGTVRGELQSIDEMDVKKQQATAAVVSAGMASLSLIISILSFIRAGKKTSAPTPPVSAPSVGTASRAA